MCANNTVDGQYLYDVPNMDSLHGSLASAYTEDVIQSKQVNESTVNYILNYTTLDVGVHLSRIVSSILNKVFKGYFLDYKYDKNHPQINPGSLGKPHCSFLFSSLIHAIL
jgi:hypothetical protein